MLTQEQKTILGKLGYYISFLALALPSRSVPTFCELLIASMITSEREKEREKGHPLFKK